LGKSAIYNSDGTEEGTTSKVELSIPSVGFFGKVNNDLIYFNDRKFYKTNGATNDFTLFKDLTNDVNSLGYFNTSYYSLGDKLVFRFGTYGGNIVKGAEFWVTDGTEEGTHILKDINPGTGDGVSYEAAVLGAKIIFQGTEPGSGSELWVTDGTPEGTQLLKDINPGSEGSKPEAFTTLGDKVIFAATEGTYGSELWITDGTPEGTTLLADLIPGSASSEARHLRAGANAVFFSAYDSEKGWTLWKTNGTATGTQRVIDVIPGNDRNKYTSNLKAVGDKFYFGADDGIHGQELWVTDGTEAGTHVIDVFPGAAGSIPTWAADVKGVAYFKADASLWRTNGTQQGTFKVSNVEPFGLTVLDNWIYFTGFHPDYGIELFKVPFTKLDQQIITESISTKTFGESPFEITASATSGLPIVITSSDELTVANKTATIVKPGTADIMIKQEGDALFNAAEAVSLTFCILPAKPTITVSSLSTGGPILISSADTGNQWTGPNGEIPGANDKTFSSTESGSYKVHTTVDGCTSECSDEEIILITGIENPEQLLTIYPNPTREQFKIQTTGYREDIQVDILNLQGKPLDGFKIHPGQSVDYSLQGYPSGIYLVKVVTSQGVAYQKVVKK
jgi:ELWxxDGT repeat protein